MLRSRRPNNTILREMCVKLVSKLNCYNINEFEEKCNPDEWEELVFGFGVGYRQQMELCMDVARKHMLELQRNRWEWFMQHWEDVPDKEMVTKCFQGLISKQFCLDFKDWLQMTDMKKRVLFMWGPPSSGKSMIIQFIQDIFIANQMTNKKTLSEYSFDSFLHSSIAVIDEIYIIPNEVEDYKRFFSGHGIHIQQKFTSKQTLQGMPILIANNSGRFGKGFLPEIDEQALKTRSYIHKLSGCVSSTRPLTTTDFVWYIMSNVGKAK